MDGQSAECSIRLHGQKRHANDNLENEQRLAKRFNLLNLGQQGKFYIPVDQGTQVSKSHESGDDVPMQLDDTKEKVYIYNLDQELSEIESEEEKVVFLPEIEKKLGKIPRSVLTSKGQPVTSNEMILYNVPSSLSVPREQDNVRRAIIETRARAREKQMQESTESQLMASNDVRPNNQFNGHRTDSGKMDLESDDGDDDDAMDVE